MEGWAFALAVLGVLISGTLAAIKIWETFLSRSDFRVHFDWIDRPANVVHLHLTVSNVGHRPDGVRAISIAANDALFQRDEIRDKLPITLGPAEISPAFVMVVERSSDNPPQAAMRDGSAILILVNSRDEEQRFPIPALGIGWSGRESVKERTLGKEL